jgi:hypothetical protein
MVETVTRSDGSQQTESRNSGGTDTLERRRRPRLQLRLQVYLSREDDPEPLRATTVDISSDGFYCLSPVALDLGKIFRCLLVVPAHDPTAHDRKMTLNCHVRVVRISHSETDQLFGIACQIEDYHFVSHLSVF